MNGCIIYCSSNREDPGLETKVKANILKVCGGLPIISVTQKPIDFGMNICVGDKVGVSGFNYFRQFLIGMEAADADYVISAEADCLYPPDYFQFVPPRMGVCYRNNNLYVMPDRRAFFFHKREGATHSQVVGREFYLDRLNELFQCAPLWSTEEMNFPKERHRKEDVVRRQDIQYWTTADPVFQIKTHRGLRYYTHSERIPIPGLPYWGDGKEIRKELLGR